MASAAMSLEPAHIISAPSAPTNEGHQRSAWQAAGSPMQSADHWVFGVLGRLVNAAHMRIKLMNPRPASPAGGVCGSISVELCSDGAGGRPGRLEVKDNGQGMSASQIQQMLLSAVSQTANKQANNTPSVVRRMDEMLSIGQQIMIISKTSRDNHQSSSVSVALVSGSHLQATASPNQQRPALTLTWEVQPGGALSRLYPEGTAWNGTVEMLSAFGSEDDLHEAAKSLDTEQGTKIIFRSLRGQAARLRQEGDDVYIHKSAQSEASTSRNTRNKQRNFQQTRRGQPTNKEVPEDYRLRSFLEILYLYTQSNAEFVRIELQGGAVCFRDPLQDSHVKPSDIRLPNQLGTLQCGKLRSNKWAWTHVYADGLLVGMYEQFGEQSSTKMDMCALSHCVVSLRLRQQGDSETFETMQALESCSTYPVWRKHIIAGLADYSRYRGGGYRDPGLQGRSTEQPPLEWTKVAMDVMKDIYAEETAKPFRDPVNLSRNPSYARAIAKPMDYSTIMSRLSGGKYSKHTEFEQDFLLVLENSITYNKDPIRPPPHFKNFDNICVPGHYTYFARKLQKKFQKMWKKAKLKLSKKGDLPAVDDGIAVVIADTPPNKQKGSHSSADTQPVSYASSKSLSGPQARPPDTTPTSPVDQQVCNLVGITWKQQDEELIFCSTVGGHSTLVALMRRIMPDRKRYWSPKSAQGKFGVFSSLKQVVDALRIHPYHYKVELVGKRGYIIDDSLRDTLLQPLSRQGLEEEFCRFDRHPRATEFKRVTLPQDMTGRPVHPLDGLSSASAQGGISTTEIFSSLDEGQQEVSSKGNADGITKGCANQVGQEADEASESPADTQVAPHQGPAMQPAARGESSGARSKTLPGGLQAGRKRPVPSTSGTISSSANKKQQIRRSTQTLPRGDGNSPQNRMDEEGSDCSKPEAADGVGQEETTLDKDAAERAYTAKPGKQAKMIAFLRKPNTEPRFLWRVVQRLSLGSCVAMLAGQGHMHVELPGLLQAHLVTLNGQADDPGLTEARKRILEDRSHSPETLEMFIGTISSCKVLEQLTETSVAEGFPNNVVDLLTDSLLAQL